MERDLQQLQIEARRQLRKATNKLCEDKSNKLTLVEARRQRCRQARYERYASVIELHRQGHTQLAIAERSGVAADTVSRWLNAGEFPERRLRSDRQRDQALLLQHQTRAAHPSLVRTHYSAGRLPALLNMPPNSRSTAQTRYLESFLRFCPKAHHVQRLGLQFRAMLRWRTAKRLSAWIHTAVASPFRFLGQFANTLRRDLVAVKLSIIKPWSNGPIEGHINRLKMIKRQMYGRAGFALLKARVLPWKVTHP
jgi:transposase